MEIALPSSIERQAIPHEKPANEPPSRDGAVKRRKSSSRQFSPDSQRSDYAPRSVVIDSRLLSYPGQGIRNQYSPSHQSLSPAGQQPDAESGFEEVNRHTHGTEYYGPVSLFSFLRRLRSRAHNQGQGLKIAERPELRNTRDARDMSIVNLLHSSDFPVTSPGSGEAPILDPQLPTNSQQPLPYQLPSPITTNSSLVRPPTASSQLLPSFPRLSNTDIERECIRLYFLNLHIIHPILNQADFISRCESEVWSRKPNPELGQNVFLALFNAVLAIGAINAGEDAAFMRDTTTVRQAERFAGGPNHTAPTYPPLKLAKLFFERAKTNLGDVFEACSLESVQTLFLMVRFLSP